MRVPNCSCLALSVQYKFKVPTAFRLHHSLCTGQTDCMPDRPTISVPFPQSVLSLQVLSHCVDRHRRAKFAKNRYINSVYRCTNADHVQFAAEVKLLKSPTLSKLGWGPPFRRAAIPRVRHSEGQPFRRAAIPRVRQSEGQPFRRAAIPKRRHSKGLSPQKPD